MTKRERRAQGSGGTTKAVINSLGLQRRLDMRRGARRPVQLGEGMVRDSLGAGDIDLGVERDQRLREIARIGGDAVLADAEHGMRAVEAVSAAQPEPGSRLLQAR